MSIDSAAKPVGQAAPTTGKSILSATFQRQTEDVVKLYLINSQIDACGLKMQQMAMLRKSSQASQLECDALRGIPNNDGTAARLFA
jgi:hypothetical protein